MVVVVVVMHGVCVCVCVCVCARVRVCVELYMLFQQVASYSYNIAVFKSKYHNIEGILNH